MSLRKDGLKVKVKWLENITPEEQKDALSSCEEVGQNLFGDYKILNDFEKRKYRVFFLYCYDMFVGWAIIDMVGYYFGQHHKKADIFINIKKRHRRKKYGTHLLNYVCRYCKKINKKPHVHPYDKSCLKFFLYNEKSCNLNIKGIYTISVRKK